MLERAVDGRERWRQMTEEIKREKVMSVLNTTAKEEAAKVRRTSIRNRPSRGSLTREESLPESLPEEYHDNDLKVDMRKISSISDPGPSYFQPLAPVPERKIATTITPEIALAVNSFPHDVTEEVMNGDNGDHLLLELAKKSSSSSDSSYSRCSRKSTDSDHGLLSDQVSRQAQVSPVRVVSTGSETSDGGSASLAV